MATSHASVLKKKAVHKSEALTGMGLQTQRHYIEVQQKINDFVDQQHASEYDEKITSHTNRYSHLSTTELLDANKHIKSLEQSKSPRPQSKSSTPKSTRRHTSSSSSSSSSSRHGTSSHPVTHR